MLVSEILYTPSPQFPEGINNRAMIITRKSEYWNESIAK